MSGDSLALTHLLLRLRPLNRALRAAVGRQARRAARLDRPELKSICVTDVHVGLLLEDVDQFVQGVQTEGNSWVSLASEEKDGESQLRQAAAEQHFSLPLDVLNDRLQLTPSETATLLICAASELNPAYERIFAYILDDLNQRFPCVELVCRLTAQSRDELPQRRGELASFGRLRRCGVIEPFGEATTGARTQLRLADGVLDFLLGTTPQMDGMWCDRGELKLDVSASSDGVDAPRILRLGKALLDGTVGVVGLWGPEDAGVDIAAQRIAQAAAKPLRKLHIAVDSGRPLREQIRNAVQSAAVLNGILLAHTDSLHDLENRATAETLAEHLAACDIPTVITGAIPWRPTELLANRTYVELPLTSIDHGSRERIWSRTIPEIGHSNAGALASQFRLTPDEIRAAGRMARAQAAIESNGKPASIDDYLPGACSAVAQKARGRFLGPVKPKRGPDDLILPPELHKQIMEISRFTRVLPQVAETWGFGRLATGGTGLKCLFTGDPGTGKTLAAEVIAGQVGTPLLKVNIAEIVSKWVGETEKNLDSAFKEATSNHAVLFFDEADALFGKRGEVRHGVDRYANLEVSHLLQRLEEHEGLVLLASNLKDNIDSAFIRRFHVALNFPRPAEAERRRIWDISFPKQAPLADDVDLSSLSRLDMTGAGIVGSARTSALLAATEGAVAISMSHVVRGVARQFRREARVLSPRELGQYAGLLHDQP